MAHSSPWGNAPPGEKFGRTRLHLAPQGHGRVTVIRTSLVRGPLPPGRGVNKEFQLLYNLIARATARSSPRGCDRAAVNSWSTCGSFLGGDGPGRRSAQSTGSTRRFSWRAVAARRVPGSRQLSIFYRAPGRRASGRRPPHARSRSVDNAVSHSHTGSTHLRVMTLSAGPPERHFL